MEIFKYVVISTIIVRVMIDVTAASRPPYLLRGLIYREILCQYFKVTRQLHIQGFM